MGGWGSVQSTTSSRGVRISGSNGSNAGYTMFWGRVQDYWLPTTLACFPFTSPTMRHRVPSGFKWGLPHPSLIAYNTTGMMDLKIMCVCYCGMSLRIYQHTSERTEEIQKYYLQFITNSNSHAQLLIHRGFKCETRARFNTHRKPTLHFTSQEHVRNSR